MKRLRCVNLLTLLTIALFVFAQAGCKDPNPEAKKEKEEKATSKTGIFGKKTSQIGEFDPTLDNKISDGKMKPTNPLNPAAALNAYGPAVEKISNIPVIQAINNFHALNGRYPKSYQEFLDRVKPNIPPLPVLPGNKVYQYDVENHCLVIVELPDDE